MVQKQRTVLIYAPYIGNGGVRRFALRMLRTWLKIADPSHWQFRVLSQPVDGNGDPLPWPEELFQKVAGDLICDNLGAKLCDFLQNNQTQFFNELRKHASDADIIWLPQPWWTMRMVGHTVDFPAHIIPTVHDYAFDELKWDGLFGDRFRDEARNFVSVSTRLIFSSEYTHRRAAERYGMQPHQGKIIYLADFVPESFNPSQEEAQRVRNAYDLPDRYWVAFHLVGHKDPLTVFEALGRTKAMDRNAFIPLVVAGVNTERMLPDAPQSDPYTDKVKACIARYGLVHGKDYRILGYIPDDDIAGLYKGAAGCLVASKSEAGFSASIFESQRAKVPLVHSDISPFTERLGFDDQYGVRFKVGDDADLARAMLSVLKDPQAATARAERAYEDFCSRTWEDVGHEYLELFEATIAQGPSTRVWSAPVDSIQIPPGLPSSVPGVVEVAPPKMLGNRIRKLFRKIKRKLRGQRS